MKSFSDLVVFLCFSIFFSACQKEFSNPGDTTLPDPDAKSFLAAAGISDKTQTKAVNDFVVQLKRDSLWNKFLAIYPMIGGTAETTKWNLKDPRDADIAYRITWNGTPDFKTTGVTCTKQTDWGDTHLADSVLSYNNSAISYYSGTENKVGGYDMGCSNTIYPYNMISIYEDFPNNVVNTWFNQYNGSQKVPATTKGLFMNSSINGQVVFYENGVATSTFGPAYEAYTNVNITIGRITDDPNMGLKECQLATIGLGLTDAEALKFYNASHAFQMALGR